MVPHINRITKTDQWTEKALIRLHNYAVIWAFYAHIKQSVWGLHIILVNNKETDQAATGA